MKAISLLQPWAELVVLTHPERIGYAEKEFETRSWSSPHRGWLLIHASKGKGILSLCEEEPFSEVLDRHNLSRTRIAERTGCIVGAARMVDCIPTSVAPSPLNEHEIDFGDWSPGRFLFRLEWPIRFTNPVPCRGALGFWSPPAEVLSAVREHFHPNAV